MRFRSGTPRRASAWHRARRPSTTTRTSRSRGRFSSTRRASSFKRTEVQAFLDYIFDHEAQIAARARFVPLTKAQLKRARTTFDLAVKAARRS